MKKTFTLIALLACVLAASAQATLGFPGEECASVGIYVKDLSTGEVLAQNDARRALLPASVMKTITCSSALTLLGPDFTFKTPVYLTGGPSPSDPTAWIGDIVIASCGDPTIDSGHFEDRTPLWREITDALSSKGIKTVYGCILIEETLQDAGYVPEWEISDVAWSYGAGLFGFNFADNASMLTLSTGHADPYLPDLWVDLTKTDCDTEMLRGIDSYFLSISGSRVYDPKSKLEISIPFPAEAYAYALDSLMSVNGIELCYGENSPNARRTLLLTHESPTLVEIIKVTLGISHNLFAEGLLRALVPDGSREDAIDYEWEFLSAHSDELAKYTRICDGSGLARGDHLQPIFVSDILEQMAASPMADTFVSCLPLVGKEGTVRRLLADTRLQGKLALKSGSMGGVQCFAGYKLGADGRPTHTVVILVNSFYCKRAEVTKAIENFLLSTFN